jgi:hypothetical protein
MSGKSDVRALATGLILDLTYGSAPQPESAFGRAVRWGQEGNAVVREILAADKPCLVARFGSTELACVNFYLRWRRGKLIPLPYPRQIRRIIQVNSGVFPTDDASLDRFSEVFLDALSRTDVMGVWFNRNEHRVVSRFCPDAQLVHLEALSSMLYEDPWSAELSGKTVLVVHPFAKTIQSQYRTRRELLFNNRKVLPEFELKTLVAVQSIAGNDCGFRTWFDALESMREQIAAADFDIALIGAGAYGLPLGASVKDLGKQAVHLGGATQLLFGIRGRRWELAPDEYGVLFNEYWVRPSAEETPLRSAQVEDGCYW